MGSSVDKLLSDDHRAIDGLFDAYREFMRTDGSRALEAFRRYKAALLRHIKCEEDLIFPLLARASGESASREVPTLREEHRVMIPLLMEVEKCLKAGSDSSTAEKRLLEVLREHNAREERRVYGVLDEFLGDSQKKAISEALVSMRFFP